MKNKEKKIVGKRKLTEKDREIILKTENPKKKIGL